MNGRKNDVYIYIYVICTYTVYIRYIYIYYIPCNVLFKDHPSFRGVRATSGVKVDGYELEHRCRRDLV